MKSAASVAVKYPNFPNFIIFYNVVVFSVDLV